MGVVYWWELLTDIARLTIPTRVYRDTELATLAFGSPGGQARAKTQAILLDGMRKFWEAAGEGEHAAQCMTVLLLQDPKFPPIPDWLQEELEEHEEAVREVLAELSNRVV